MFIVSVIIQSNCRSVSHPAVFTSNVQCVRLGNELIMACVRLQLTAVYVMEILLALLGVGECALCIWGSILCCCSTGCCATTQPAVFAVICLLNTTFK